MQALLVVVNVLLVLNAIILIVAVLMQDGARAGLGSIGGGAETFFGKSKAKSYEGKLEMITKVGAGVFIVLAILMTALNARVSNVSTPVETVTPEAADEAAADADATAMPEAEDTATEDEADAVEATEAPAAAEADAAEATEAPAASDDGAAEATEAPAATEAGEVEATEAPAA